MFDLLKVSEYQNVITLNLLVHAELSDFQSCITLKKENTNLGCAVISVWNEKQCILFHKLNFHAVHSMDHIPRECGPRCECSTFHHSSLAGCLILHNAFV